MQMSQPPKQNKSKSDVLRYAGWGTQLFVALALAVFGGMKLDAWAQFSIPLAVWILPLFVLFVMIYQLIKAITKTKSGNEEE